MFSQRLPRRSGTGFNAASPPAIGGTTPGPGSFNPLTIGAIGSQSILQGDNANIIGQRNGVNAQMFSYYNTFTDVSNFERGFVGWTGSTFTVSTAVAGTGSVRNMSIGPSGAAQLFIQTGGSTRWSFNSSGHLTTATDVVSDLGDATHSVRDAYIRRRIGKIDVVVYSASMTPDASLGEAKTITITNATAFAINAPTSPLTGQYTEYLLRNTSGGAAGVATWNAIFKMTAWTQPANGFSRSILFRYDGTNWVEVDRGAADVPN